MRTVWRIATREWIDWTRDRWRLTAMLLVAVVAALAGLTGAVGASARTSAALSAQKADYQRWLSQPPRNAHSASHFGISAFYVPSRFAVVDPGVGAYAGSALFLEAHKQNEPVFTEALDRGSASRFGELSLSTVLQIWLPLIIILLGAGVIAADREDGILPQLLAVGVAPWQVAAGKALAVTVTAMAVLVPSVVAVGLVLASSDGAWPVDARWRLGSFAVACVAYLVFWVAATIAVSARARSWRLSIATLAILWCVAVVVLPRLTSDIARARNPLPSRAEQDRRELEARMMGPGGPDARRQAILTEYGVQTADQLPVDISVIIAQRVEEAINSRLDERMRDNAAVYEAERGDYLRASWLTPAIAMDVASAGTAGSDDVHHRAFVERAEHYRRQMMDMLNAADERKPGEPAGRADAAVWTRLPMFEPAVPSMGDTSSRVGLALSALGVWSLMACAVAVWSVRRMGARA
jgi:ABC-2 type transport system permease protein